MTLKYTNSPNVKPKDLTKGKRKRVAAAKINGIEVGKDKMTNALLDIERIALTDNENKKRPFKVIKGGKD